MEMKLPFDNAPTKPARAPRAIPLPAMGARKDGKTRYRCSRPGCGKGFLITEHGQRHCSPKCCRAERKIERAGQRKVGMGTDSQTPSLAKSDPMKSMVLGGDNEALAERYAAAELSLQSPADKAALARARAPDEVRRASGTPSIFLSPEEHDALVDDVPPTDRERRRRYDALTHDAADKARAADTEGTLRTRIAAKQALAAAIARRT
jgi:hypothetical protein